MVDYTNLNKILQILIIIHTFFYYLLPFNCIFFLIYNSIDNFIFKNYYKIFKFLQFLLVMALFLLLLEFLIFSLDCYLFSFVNIKFLTLNNWDIKIRIFNIILNQKLYFIQALILNILTFYLYLKLVIFLPNYLYHPSVITVVFFIFFQLISLTFIDQLSFNYKLISFPLCPIIILTAEIFYLHKQSIKNYINNV